MCRSSREEGRGKREQGKSPHLPAPSPNSGRGAGGEGRLRLLATAWLLEPDRETLERLAAVQDLRGVVATITPEQAALEYGRVVLREVPPYASLFLDEEAMLNGPHAERAELAYRRAGFEIRSEWRAGPADHLGVELHFLAHLLERDDASPHAFLVEHVLPWAPVCLLAIARVESAAFYPLLAEVTLDTLKTLGPSPG